MQTKTRIARMLAAGGVLAAALGLTPAPASAATTHNLCVNDTMSAGPTTVQQCVNWWYSGGRSAPLSLSLHNYGYSTVDVTRAAFKNHDPNVTYIVSDCPGFNARIYPGQTKNFTWCSDASEADDYTTRSDGYLYVTVQLGVVGYGYNWYQVTNEP